MSIKAKLILFTTSAVVVLAVVLCLQSNNVSTARFATHRVDSSREGKLQAGWHYEVEKKYIRDTCYNGNCSQGNQYVYYCLSVYRGNTFFKSSCSYYYLPTTGGYEQ